jgi:hypothetical protein
VLNAEKTATAPQPWQPLILPYRIVHSPAHHGPGRYDESWLLDAMSTGHGLTTFPTERQARDRAEEIFGPPAQVIFTISILSNRTRIHVRAVPDTDPAKALEAAISALEAEMAALTNCPQHSRDTDRSGIAQPEPAQPKDQPNA